MDHRSALSLYDCLVPRLRENRKLKIPERCYTDKNLADDIQAKHQIFKLEHYREQKRLPKLTKDNRQLSERADQLERENEMFNWMQGIVEANFKLDAFNIIENYEQLAIDHNNYVSSAEDQISQLQDQLARSKTEGEEMLEKMKKLTDTVVKPLINEVMARQQEINDIKDDKSKAQKNLKMLHAIIRSPMLSDLYAKQDRKMMTEKQI